MPEMVLEPNSAETSHICEAWICHREQSTRKTKTRGGNQILMRGEIPHFPKFSFSYNLPHGPGLGDTTKMKSTHQLCLELSTEKCRNLRSMDSRSTGRKDDHAKTVRGCVFLAGPRPQQPLADRRPARLSQASRSESPSTDTMAHDCDGNLCAETRNWGLWKDSRGKAN